MLVLLVSLILLVFIVLLVLLVLLLLLILLVVVLAASLLLLLLLLLLHLLEKAPGEGEVVAGVVVLGVELQGFLIRIEGFLEQFLLLVLHAGLEQAVAAVVQRVGATAVAGFGVGQGLFVVVSGIVVFPLSIEGAAEIVLAAGVGGVALQSTAVGDFGLVVAFLVILAVAFAQLMARSLCRNGELQDQKGQQYGCFFHSWVSKRFHLRLLRSKSTSSASRHIKAATRGYW